MALKYFDEVQNRWVWLPGLSGKDAYEIAQEEGEDGSPGFDGSRQEFYNLLIEVAKALKEMDDKPTKDSEHLVKSGGVYDAIQECHEMCKENLDAAVEKLQQAVDELQNQNGVDLDEIRKKLQALREDHEALDTRETNDRTELEAKIDSLRSTHEADKEALETEIDNLEAKHDRDKADLQGQINDLDADITNLETKHDKDKAELELSISTQVAKEQKDVDDLNDRIDALDATHKADKAELDGEIESLQNRVTVNETNITNLETQHNKDKAELELSISTLEAKHDQDKNALQNSIDAQSAKEKQDVEDLNGKISDLSATEKSDKAELDGKIEALNTNVTNNYFTKTDIEGKFENINENIQDGALSGGKLADDSVTGDKIKDGTLEWGDFSIELQEKIEALKITVDASLNSTSTNPVENRAIYGKLQELESDINSIEGNITSIQGQLASCGNVYSGGDLTSDKIVVGAGGHSIHTSNFSLDDLVTSSALSSKLSGYATESWVQSYVSSHGGSGSGGSGEGGNECIWVCTLDGGVDTEYDNGNADHDSTFNDGDNKYKAFHLSHHPAYFISEADHGIGIKVDKRSDNNYLEVKYRLRPAANGHIGGVKLFQNPQEPQDKKQIRLQLDSQKRAYCEVTKETVKEALRGYITVQTTDKSAGEDLMDINDQNQVIIKPGNGIDISVEGGTITISAKQS